MSEIKEEVRDMMRLAGMNMRMQVSRHKLAPHVREEQFWLKVEKTAYCWNWLGKSTNFHYLGKIEKAPRLSYKLSGKEIPEDSPVFQLCGNKKCVNPQHLSVTKVRQGEGWSLAEKIEIEKIEIKLGKL